MNKIKYALISTYAALLTLIGYLGLKFSILIVATSLSILFEKYIGGFGLIVSFIISLFVGSLVIFGFQKFYPYIEGLEEIAKTHKRYPYTEKYGINYPHPKAEDFGISQNEFKEYNSRFQFEYIKLIFSYGVLFSACIYVIQIKLKLLNGLILISVAVAIAILLDRLFNYWNKKISQKHKHYYKIDKFQESLKIYYKIRDENSV